MRAEARRVVRDIRRDNKAAHLRVLMLCPIRHRVRPALAHARALVRLQAARRPAARHAVRDPVRVLAHRHVVLKRPIALRVRRVPQEHRHQAVLLVGGRREVRVVEPMHVLDRHAHAVAVGAALAKVVILEVERGLGEAVDVRDVVHGVHNVEAVRDRRREVVRRGRVSVGVLGEYKVLAGGRLLGGAQLIVLERDGVVATCVGSRCVAVVVPSLRRCLKVRGIVEHLKALHERLLGNGENAVLYRPMSALSSALDTILEISYSRTPWPRSR